MDKPPVRSGVPDARDAWHEFDRARESQVGRLTGGISPEALALAWADWAMHLAVAPGKRTSLALHEWGRPLDVGADPRFHDPAWQTTPFRDCAEAFLRAERWWSAATHDVPGVSPHHEAVVAFVARQLLDVGAPSNFPWANPQVLAQTAALGGRNLWTGALHWWEDFAKLAAGPGQAETQFLVGRGVAATPGKVVMRNELVELIQYTPTTARVHAEPVLIVPAWIMKYYILDLSPHNSLVRWLVSQGHTVFCLSWRNVGPEDRALGLDDYRQLGIMAALDAVAHRVPGRRVHATGYCLGGTLLALTAAALARAGDERLASLSLFAAQTDFTEPGELGLFIDSAQLHMLDSMMDRQGVLSAQQMAGAFQMLRSNDLIWSRMVQEYLMGERPPPIDLMAWNADATRMPYRMHSEYLHRLYLGNDLAAGRYVVDGHTVVLQNLKTPVFMVGTESDHVAPWRSVYKLHYLTEAELTFVLCNGGHNAGIVNEPGHPHRHYRIATRAAGAPCASPDEWLDASPAPRDGSWWTAWHDWLIAHGSGRRVAPPRIDDSALGDAPGRYVLEP
ncbi:MAG: alpha/beta fold hydrolase [Paucibacter sp.]|nr:alpha/beta fold hydrolase [Roseateles sp.]